MSRAGAVPGHRRRFKPLPAAIRQIAPSFDEIRDRVDSAIRHVAPSFDDIRKAVVLVSPAVRKIAPTFAEVAAAAARLPKQTQVQVDAPGAAMTKSKIEDVTARARAVPKGKKIKVSAETTAALHQLGEILADRVGPELHPSRSEPRRHR